MTQLLALWLPILVSAVIVFVASSVIHMAPLLRGQLRHSHGAALAQERLSEGPK